MLAVKTNKGFLRFQPFDLVLIDWPRPSLKLGKRRFTILLNNQQLLLILMSNTSLVNWLLNSQWSLMITNQVIPDLLSLGGRVWNLQRIENRRSWWPFWQWVNIRSFSSHPKSTNRSLPWFGCSSIGGDRTTCLWDCHFEMAIGGGVFDREDLCVNLRSSQKWGLNTSRLGSGKVSAMRNVNQYCLDMITTDNKMTMLNNFYSCSGFSRDAFVKLFRCLSHL